jgi:hypothetical protein
LPAPTFKYKFPSFGAPGVAVLINANSPTFVGCAGADVNAARVANVSYI